MRVRLCLLLLILCWVVGGHGKSAAGPTQSAIPDRPEALIFPPLSYSPPLPADHRVVLPRSGVPAYLFSDRSLPVVRVAVYVRAGAVDVPPGKEGLKELVEYLLPRGGQGNGSTRGQGNGQDNGSTHGNGTLSSQTFDRELLRLAADLQISVGDTSTLVALELLSPGLADGLSLLRGLLAQPLFDEAALSRGKNTLRLRMLRRNDSSTDIEVRERDILSLGKDHFTTRAMTAASVAALTRADVVDFHRRRFQPAHMVLAVSGDFDKDALVARLDDLFASWPVPPARGGGDNQVEPRSLASGKDDAGRVPAPPPGDRAAPGLYVVDKQEVNQARVSLLLPGIGRGDPDYPAAQVLDQILGAGGRTSRLPARLRGEESLVYQVGSSFPGGVYYPEPLSIQFQARPGACGYALQLAFAELQRLHDSGVSDDEVTLARTHLLATLPQRFRTPAQAAATLALEEVTGRYDSQPDYWQRQPGRVAQVSAQDVKRVAERFLDLKKAIVLVVGRKAGLLAPDPRHPVLLSAAWPKDAAPGVVERVELPLRDPLTFMPLPLPARSP